MNFKYILPLALSGAMALSSCSDEFLENKPQGSLSDGMMNNPENVNLLVNAAYAALYGFTNEQGDPWVRPLTNWSYGEVRADNAYKGGGGEGDLWDIHAMETFQVQTNNGGPDGRWFNLYSLISRCQSALRVLNQCSDDFPNKASRIAEVKVLRSHFYFMLQRDFNKIPYMDENLAAGAYVDVPNDEFTRQEHLERIYQEFLAASKDLPDRQAEIGRINKNVALAYAAKVRLYQAYEQDEQTHAITGINKQYLQDVITLIDQVKGYDLLADFQHLDLVEYENGPEGVFVVQFSSNDGSGDLGRINWSNLLNSIKAEGDMPDPANPNQMLGNGDGFFLPSQDLIDAYQTDANGLPCFDYQQMPHFAEVVYEEIPGTNEKEKVVKNKEGFVDPRLDFVVGRPGIRYKTYPVKPAGSWVRDIATYGHNCTKRFFLSPESEGAYKGWPWLASELNWNIIRYADLLLYKAEALIELGQDLETARVLINKVRERAKNSAYVKDFDNPSVPAANYRIEPYPATGWTQDYARKALRTEMRLEKALEGERYYDLVRWGIAKETMTKYFDREKAARIYYAQAQFDNGEEYLPVPVAQYNFSLGRYTQNPGYPAFK